MPWRGRRTRRSSVGGLVLGRGLGLPGRLSCDGEDAEVERVVVEEEAVGGDRDGRERESRSMPWSSEAVTVWAA